MEDSVQLSAANPFAQLADPSILLEVHQRFSARVDIDRQVHLRMDSPARTCSSEQAAFDASIEAQDAVAAARAKSRDAERGAKPIPKDAKDTKAAAKVAKPVAKAPSSATRAATRPASRTRAAAVEA